MKKEIRDCIIRVKVTISLWQAIKLRLAGIANVISKENKIKIEEI